MKNKTVISLFVLILTTLACSLMKPGLPTGQAPGETPEIQTTPLPVATPDSQPVSISEGLASLNSYRTILTINSSGPDPKNSTMLSFETKRSNDSNAQFTHITSTSIQNGQPGEGDNNSEIYRIGNDQCSGSGEDWSYEIMEPNRAEMMDMVMSMFGFTPTTDNSVFVAQETVNGIPVNHFSFKVKGLGVKSGANVTINQGDYWLAVDGQYLVKYSLVAETVMDPNTNIIHMETIFEVNDINQPLTITFPQVCLDAAQVTPSAP
ncbi:MAG: hypothetical protein HZB50_07350 [Chloroflexi bacterium]|nr:hypothetical protein [Chloroflexota bacterium]